MSPRLPPLAVRWIVPVVLALGATTPARAEDPRLRPAYDLRTDLEVTALAAGGSLALLGLKGDLAPLRCRWCGPPAFDADVTRALGWSNRDAASTTSNVLEVALGAGVLGNALLEGYRAGDPEAGLVNVLLITEATSIALLLDTGVKYAVGRSRPYVWLSGSATDTRDGNLSFFSGHATFAFAVAASSSTLLFEQRAPGAGIASAAAFGVAGFIGYLRIAADAHYLSDVLAGAAVGSLVGWAVPHFFHPSQDGAVQLRPAPGGVAITW